MFRRRESFKTVCVTYLQYRSSAQFNVFHSQVSDVGLGFAPSPAEKSDDEGGEREQAFVLAAT